MESRTGPGTEHEGAERAGARRRTTWLFALAVLLIGAVQSLALAPWMGEDEPWHLEYARHVAAGYRPWGGLPASRAQGDKPDDRVLMSSSQLQVRRRFAQIPAERITATQEAILGSMAARNYYQRVDWAGVEPERENFDQVAPDFTAATQSPFYYLVAGGFLGLTGAEDVEAQLWVLRGLSLALYVAAALVVLAIARTALSDERLALCAAALFAFLPMSARQAAVVNPDVLAKLMVAAVVLGVVRALTGVGRRAEIALAVSACALGLLTDSTAAAGLVALLALPFLRSKRLTSRAVTTAYAVGIAAVVAAVGFVWFTQHNPALPRSLIGLRTRLAAGLSLDNWIVVGRELVGGFGWETRFLPDALNALVWGLGVAALALGARAAWRGTALASRPVLVLCLVIVAAQLAMVFLRGSQRGRYLMPVLPAYSVLAVVGWCDLVPESSRARFARYWIGGLVALEALFLWGGLLFQEHLRWSV
jgi:4-amino-4-deoxy-L-arabinose transferase-like glycosyltransferase